MYVVIFRARIRAFDAEYARTAARLRDLALSQFGCLEFHAVTEGDSEVALSYWSDEASIRAWRAHPEHQLAQHAGQERWYASYTVQVATVTREYARD
ncbi:MAG TPA: antibiotic biosynthesis monooxygenase [Steroidobacteraceae bacterium]|jgi:heme-degrading monooxygenase HmoA|nr:antibiotic biosynthesis monooxygenase [Steroidobacteraceae bacterium]